MNRSHLKDCVRISAMPRTRRSSRPTVDDTRAMETCCWRVYIASKFTCACQLSWTIIPTLALSRVLRPRSCVPGCFGAQHDRWWPACQSMFRQSCGHSKHSVVSAACAWRHQRPGFSSWNLYALTSTALHHRGLPFRDRHHVDVAGVVYVGNLPPDVKEKEVDDLFYKVRSLFPCSAASRD